MSPARPHPSQIVDLSTSKPAQIGDQVDLVDARGGRWRIATGVRSHEVSFKLPDDVADGEAAVRVGRTKDGVDSFGAPMTFVITSGPVPLGGVALGMTPVAPGQWTDLLKDHLVEYRAPTSGIASRSSSSRATSRSSLGPPVPMGFMSRCPRR